MQRTVFPIVYLHSFYPGKPTRVNTKKCRNKTVVFYQEEKK